MSETSDIFVSNCVVYSTVDTFPGVLGGEVNDSIVGTYGEHYADPHEI